MGRASEKRKARVRSLLMATLADVVRTELNDPRLELFSITDLRLSKDLTSARVLVSAVGGPEASEQCAKILQTAAPLLWNRLRDETDLRHVPHLKFEVDHGPEYQAEIERLLMDIPPAAEDDSPEEEDSPGQGDGG